MIFLNYWIVPHPVTSKILLSLLLAVATIYAARSQSVLQTGHWFKVAVGQRGVYKISGDQFQKMGFGAGVDPKRIRVYGNPGGMLPQPNAQPRPEDLQEIAILVADGDDGSFDKNDNVLFFAEGPDRVHYDAARETFFYESNLYSKQNYYFITVSPDAGKRIAPAIEVSGTHPIVDTYNDYVYHESDEYND